MMLLLLLIACLASATYASDVECYSCHGVIATSPNCGTYCDDVLDPNVCGEKLDMTQHTNTTTCNGFCQTKSTYHLEEKIYVDRECVPQCEEACFLTFGTGACFSCCDSDLCNKSNGKSASLWLLGMSVVATGITLRLLL